jgi:hypothetical protein
MVYPKPSPRDTLLTSLGSQHVIFFGSWESLQLSRQYLSCHFSPTRTSTFFNHPNRHDITRPCPWMITTHRLARTGALVVRLISEVDNLSYISLDYFDSTLCHVYRKGACTRRGCVLVPQTSRASPTNSNLQVSLLHNFYGNQNYSSYCCIIGLSLLVQY